MPLPVREENPAGDDGMNANTLLRVFVSIVLTEGQLRDVYPKGYKKLERARVETECQGD